MKIIVCDTYEEMSQKAAKIIAAQLVLKPDSVLGLPTGSTPVGTYKALAEMNKKGDIDFKDIITFNLDEYYPISPENDQSYRYFMNKTFFEHINIDINNTCFIALEFNHKFHRLASFDHREVVFLLSHQSLCFLNTFLYLFPDT